MEGGGRLPGRHDALRRIGGCGASRGRTSASPPPHVARAA